MKIQYNEIFNRAGRQHNIVRCNCGSCRLIPVVMYMIEEYKEFVVNCKDCGAEMGPGAKIEYKHTGRSSIHADTRGTFGRKVGPGPNCYGYMHK